MTDARVSNYAELWGSLRRRNVARDVRIESANRDGLDWTVETPRLGLRLDAGPHDSLIGGLIDVGRMLIIEW